jgi:hypothetical protein
MSIKNNTVAPDKVQVHNFEVITHTKEVDIPVLDEKKIQKELQAKAEQLLLNAIANIDIKGMIQIAVKEATKDLVINNAVRNDVIVNNAVIRDIDSNLAINLVKNALDKVTEKVKIKNAIVEDVHVKNAVIDEIPKKDVLDMLKERINEITKYIEIERPVFVPKSINNEVADIVDKILSEKIEKKQLKEYEFKKVFKDDIILTPVLYRVAKLISHTTGKEIDI